MGGKGCGLFYNPTEADFDCGVAVEEKRIKRSPGVTVLNQDLNLSLQADGRRLSCLGSGLFSRNAGHCLVSDLLATIRRVDCASWN